VISGEPISADDRHALRQVLPAAALLDEHDLLTILFSSEDPEVRALHLARALAWQIPLEWASPFSDQGDVAHAMFVGRETVLSKFLDPQGPTILYGGRKLGKSSIFRQLERAFKEARPGRNVAVYVNAIDIVDGEGIEGHLLPNVMRQINKAVRDLPINDDLTALDVHNSPKTIQCDEFRTRISRLLQALPDHHFLLLVDEADSLLQHLDCANDPLLPASQRFGWSLRALAQESNYRFDIRFAGFQEISRAGQSQSGPFFNFRRGTSNEPLSVLDEPDARILVVRPLQVLGAQFADASLVDLILNFTGRHPALIQDFCRRLYFRVRGPHTREAFRITREDVEAIWQNPDFRKTVVQAIYLNVDTRNTRMEKLMRLVLFLWVQQLMAPAQDFDFPPICEANDLFLLLVRKFGEGPVENQVLLTELDNHLTDLSALGVLERLDHDGIRYSFRYRHFASLLFYDSLSGRLEERVIQALWDSIVHHDNRLPRVQIRTDVGLSMSPFRRDDQQRLERESHRMLLVVGAPGTGKSAYFHWLQDHTQEHARIIVVPSRQRSLPELRILLAEALSLTPPPPSWQAFHDQLSAQDRKWDAPLWIVMDDLDDLAGQDDWPLVTWPDDDTVSHDDGLLQMLGRIEENSRGQLRFFALGTYPLTRLWIDLQTSIQERVDVVATRPLAEREIDGWCESTRLVAVQEVKREIWRLTGGDWRMLSALRAWLKAQALEAPDVDDIRRFAGTLYQSVGDPMFALLRNDIQSYSLTTHAIVSEMVRLTGGKASNATVADWADLLLAPVRDRLSVAAADLTSHQIEIEIKAAVVLGDLALHSDGFQVELPTNGRWLSLLDRHWVHD